jgi:hypothetical protein
VKNTSGLIWDNPHRAAVAMARQKMANPTPKSGVGWEIPCQPRLNSSINFPMDIVTSRDQLIQNKAENRRNRAYRGTKDEAGLCLLRPEHGPEKWIPVFREDHAQTKG